ncbi:MAG: hypothetical protein AAB728_00220, partial [Patescibacteria group bacterium]
FGVMVSSFQGMGSGNREERDRNPETGRGQLVGNIENAEEVLFRLPASSNRFHWRVERPTLFPWFILQI